jgi:enoyl-CoA hydratase/carnithine racemase
VEITREAETLRLTLARPASENGMTAEMRDALVEALRAARADPDIRTVEIRGKGRVFCTGGALGEFGTATDLALAHHIRTVRSVALAIHRLAARTRLVLHGAAVGSGLEIAAVGDEVIAHPATLFRLPEVSMGLIPGAGGTVTVARRIGRRRAGYLALSGARVRARTALAWGLIDGLGEV